MSSTTPPSPAHSLSRNRSHASAVDQEVHTPRLHADDGGSRDLPKLFRTPSAPTLNALARPLYPLRAHDTKKPETQTKVINLTQQAMSRYRLEFKNGRIYDAKGQLWSTGDYSAKFVMRPDGVVFAGVKAKQPREGNRSLHHSSFMTDSVAAAGLLKVADGHALYVICDSGHYQPKPTHLAQFLQELRKHGFELHGLPAGVALGSRMCWFDAAYLADHPKHLLPMNEVAEPPSYTGSEDEKKALQDLSPNKKKKSTTVSN